MMEEIYLHVYKTSLANIKSPLDSIMEEMEEGWMYVPYERGKEVYTQSYVYTHYVCRGVRRNVHFQK